MFLFLSCFLDRTWYIMPHANVFYSTDDVESNDAVARTEITGTDDYC